MNYPLVSVIIPNYNHSKYLVERIESVLNQVYENFEVIILDDCSTDNSAITSFIFFFSIILSRLISCYKSIVS